MSPPLGSVEVKGAVIVREQQGNNVKPSPKGEGDYKSYGYDNVSELNHNIFDVIVELEGHRRAVRVPR